MHAMRPTIYNPNPMLPAYAIGLIGGCGCSLNVVNFISPVASIVANAARLPTWSTWRHQASAVKMGERKATHLSNLVRANDGRHLVLLRPPPRNVRSKADPDSLLTPPSQHPA